MPERFAAGMRSGTVLETMDAAGYTYLHVDTGEETFWAAAPPIEVEVGQNVFVPGGMAMENFHSSALDRDFDVVYFVEGVRVGEMAAGTPSEMPSGHPGVSAEDELVPTVIESGTIEPLEGGSLVADILSDGQGRAGQTVKFNPNIMGTNWLHVQDGSGEPGRNDLTVRTMDVVSVGQTVVVTGVVATDQDFGFGYSYDVLVEDATIVVE